MCAYIIKVSVNELLPESIRYKNGHLYKPVIWIIASITVWDMCGGKKWTDQMIRFFEGFVLLKSLLLNVVVTIVVNLVNQIVISILAVSILYIAGVI